MITKFTGDGLFFTSDTHFNHENILRFCNRPFKTIQEHDEVLIDNWNSVVGPDDTVFHLGDFCFGNPQKVIEVRKKLNGHIFLIRGNHDDKNLQASLYPLFEEVLYQARILVDKRTVYLNHFPFMCFAHWDSSKYDRNALSFALSGHTHIRRGNTGSDASFTKFYLPTQYDVGVDFNDFKPVSWEEINRKVNYQIDNQCNLRCWMNEELSDS